MKRLIIRFRLLLLALLLGGAYGCKDGINLVPQDVIPVNGFYKTEADMHGSLLGTYGSLRTIYNSFFLFGELPSDNTRTFSESEVSTGMFDRLNWVTSTGQISGMWNNLYGTIAGANIFLGRVDPIQFATPAGKTQAIGEAKFLRALAYFNLVRIFGDVPLVLTEITTTQEALSLTRNPTTEVYAQIEKDLLAAEASLPVSYTGTSVGRATSGAAKALLGKAYLQQKRWADAEKKLAEVIAANTYQLLPDLNNVFGQGKDNNAEIIFACQYFASGNAEGNTFSREFAPSVGTTITALGGGSTNIGTLDLYNAFETGDLRKGIYITPFTGPNGIYYYAKKFVYYVTLTNEGDNDWPILRYADVLLMYAEALNNNGKTTLAQTQINLVRKRAGLPALAATLAAADTQLAIEQERRVELCFEGHRWHDLARWGKAIPTIAAFKTKYTTLDAANANITADSYRVLFPIPQREVLLNANLVQNPGY